MIDASMNFFGFGVGREAWKTIADCYDSINAFYGVQIFMMFCCCSNGVDTVGLAVSNKKNYDSESIYDQISWRMIIIFFMMRMCVHKESNNKNEINYVTMNLNECTSFIALQRYSFT